MRCGEKCFLVEMKIHGKTQTIPVRSRTPQGARKTVRSEFGKETNILSVKEEKRSH